MRCIGEEIEHVEGLDGALASLARGETALRLRLGQTLEALSPSGCHELGFSSLSAYALERCDRSVRWVEAARCVARRVEGLSELRCAMAFGHVSWSVGELLARVAQPGNEAHWLDVARSRTVRQMRTLVAAALADRRRAGGEAVGAGVAHPGAAAGVCGSRGTIGAHEGGEGHDGAHDGAGPRRGGGTHAARKRPGDCEQYVGAYDGDGAPDGGGPDPDPDPDGDGDGDAMCHLTCTVTQEDAWLFEATRALLGQLGVQGSDAQSEALLAEGQDTLLAALPSGTLDVELERLEGFEAHQQRRRVELGRKRAEAEAACEQTIRASVTARREAGYDAGAMLGLEAGLGSGAGRGASAGADHGNVPSLAAGGMFSLKRLSCEELDGQVRALARALARHELELSRLVLRFHRADGWRQLGYASEAQYARERLGVSLSSLLGRRSLAVRLERLPHVATALGAGQIGVEAASQVVRAATPTTEAAWVERARERTIKHLREEVSAALVAVRCSSESNCPPPTQAELAAFWELEQAVVSGRACRGRPGGSAGAAQPGPSLVEPASEQRRAWCVMLGSLAAWLDSGLQMSAGASRAGSRVGRVTLRLRMSRGTYAWWRTLEAAARCWLARGMSWIRFLCLSLWQAWQHQLGAAVGYDRIYVRDRYRCTSPVCSRRDVTPHHLRFRSAGGGDDDDNVASVCTWCHLCGVHGGRIRAAGSARQIHWELGSPSSPCVIVHGRDRFAGAV